MISISCREALICERHRPWSWKVAELQFANLKACPGYQLVDFAIEMTTTCEPFPNRR